MLAASSRAHTKNLQFSRALFVTFLFFSLFWTHLKGTHIHMSVQSACTCCFGHIHTQCRVVSMRCCPFVVHMVYVPSATSLFVADHRRLLLHGLVLTCQLSPVSGTMDRRLMVVWRLAQKTLTSEKSIRECIAELSYLRQVLIKIKPCLENLLQSRQFCKKFQCFYLKWISVCSCGAEIIGKMRVKFDFGQVYDFVQNCTNNYFRIKPKNLSRQEIVGSGFYHHLGLASSY